MNHRFQADTVPLHSIAATGAKCHSRIRLSCKSTDPRMHFHGAEDLSDEASGATIGIQTSHGIVDAPEAVHTADQEAHQLPSFLVQDLMKSYQSVEDGAWQACASSMMVLHGDFGFTHFRFNDLVALFQ